MLTNRLELLSSHRNGDYGDALPLSYVSIIQKCLHPLIVFEFIRKEEALLTRVSSIALIQALSNGCFFVWR